MCFVVVLVSTLRWFLINTPDSTDWFVWAPCTCFIVDHTQHQPMSHHSVVWRVIPEMLGASAWTIVCSRNQAAVSYLQNSHRFDVRDIRDIQEIMDSWVYDAVRKPTSWRRSRSLPRCLRRRREGSRMVGSVLLIPFGWIDLLNFLRFLFGFGPWCLFVGTLLFSCLMLYHVHNLYMYVTIKEGLYLLVMQYIPLVCLNMLWSANAWNTTKTSHDRDNMSWLQAMDV